MKIFGLSFAKTVAKKANAKLKLYYKTEYKYYTGTEAARVKAQTDRYADIVSSFILRFITETGCLPSGKTMWKVVSRMSLLDAGDPYRDVPSEYDFREYKNQARTEKIMEIVAPKLYDVSSLRQIGREVTAYLKASDDPELRSLDPDPYVVSCRLFDIRFVGANIKKPEDIAEVLFIRYSNKIKISSALREYLNDDLVYRFIDEGEGKSLEYFGAYLETNPKMCEDLLEIALKYI